MINRVQYSPSFQKKLVAKVNLPSQNGVENCSIYELDEGKKDAKRLKKQTKKQNWLYSNQIIEDLKIEDNPLSKMLKPKVFSLEDEKKNCLGLLKTFDFVEMKNIDFIEVNPNYQSSKKDAKVKNIGSALITYLFKANEDKNFIVLYPVTSAREFYKKIGFDYSTSSMTARFNLPADRVSSAIENNEKRIGSTIEMMG